MLGGHVCKSIIGLEIECKAFFSPGENISLNWMAFDPILGPHYATKGKPVNSVKNVLQNFIVHFMSFFVF